MQNNRKHLSDIILKWNHAHLALAARFYNRTSAAWIASCSNALNALLFEAIYALLSKLTRSTSTK